MKADCLDSSYMIFKKHGFKKVREKQFKKFKIHYMIKESDSLYGNNE